MSEYKNIYLTNNEISKLQILKNDKSKMYIYKDMILKEDISKKASRYRSYFEDYLKNINLINCIFPSGILFIDMKEKGYIQPFLNNFSSIGDIIKKEKIHLKNKKIIINKIFDTVNKLHNEGIVHGDMHLNNFMYNGDNIALVDFDNIKIKDLENDSIYYGKLKTEIKYLNLLFLSILFDKNLLMVDEYDLFNFIDQLKIDNEYKLFLYDCINYEDSIIDIDSTKYISKIKQNIINDGKKLVKKL